MFGFSVAAWMDAVRDCLRGNPPPVVPERKPGEACAVIADPLLAVKIARALIHLRPQIQKYFRSPVNIPPSVGRIYCPRCWASLLCLFPSDSMYHYVASVEAQYQHDCSAVVVHDDVCPFTTTRNGCDPTLIAFHLRRFYAHSLKRLASESQTRSGPKGPVLEGYSRKTYNTTDAGDDFAVHKPDAQYEREKLLKLLEAEQERVATNAVYQGDSWADIMDEYEAEENVRWIQEQLADMDEAESSNKRKFDRGEPEGPREDFAHVLRARARENLELKCMQDREKKEEKIWNDNTVFWTGLHKERLLAHAAVRSRELKLEAREVFDDLLADFYSGLRDLRRKPAPVVASAQLEGAAPTVFCDDDRFFPIVDDQAFAAAFEAGMRKSMAAIARHKEVGKKMAQAAAQTRTVKAEDPPRPNLESEISGSKKLQFGSNSGLLLMNGSPRGCLAFPYGNVRDKSAGTCLVTHRHAFSEEKRAFVDAPAKLGQPVDVYLKIDSDGVPRSGTVVSAVANENEDIMYLYTNVSPHGLGTFKCSKLGVGKAVTQWTAMLAQGEDGCFRPQWSSTIGKVCHVAGNAVYYDITTMRGDCGFPVYQADGTVAAIHLAGNVEYLPSFLANAGTTVDSRRRSPPAKGTLQLPGFQPNPCTPEHQGRVTAEGELKFVVDSKRYRLRERLVYRGLRVDRRLDGLVPLHHYMKPSTEMNHKEVAKFGDQLEYKLDAPLFDQAAKAAVLYDLQDNCATPFVPPIFEDLIRIINVELDLTKSSGPVGESLTAEQYLQALGLGDIEKGKKMAAERVMRLYNTISQPISTNPDADLALACECMYWNVIGKKDGYKEKKLPTADPPGSGRTIQAPSFECKLLWKACFGENDSTWIHRLDSWVHAGEDSDLPLTYTEVEDVKQAVGAIAADLTAFDRYMLPEFIKAFFFVYLPMACPGVPKPMLQWLCAFVAQGPLLMSDGTIYRRQRGHPSGFMSTLRLNCVVHLMVTMYVFMKRLGVTDPEVVAKFAKDQTRLHMCGDDSLHYAMTEQAMEVFDIRNGGKAYLDVWATDLPWEIKIEGLATFSPNDTLESRCYNMPPIVSRRLLVMHGIVFAPLYNISRVLKRLSCAEKRSDEEELALMNSGMATLALQLWWMSRGWFHSTALEYFWREYGHLCKFSIVHDRVTGLYRQQPRQMKPAEPIDWTHTGIV